MDEQMTLTVEFIPIFANGRFFRSLVTVGNRPIWHGPLYRVEANALAEGQRFIDAKKMEAGDAALEG